MSIKKTIVLVGDSHTWGQGAEENMIFYPPVQAGDLRPIQFYVPNYANLLRMRINELTGSENFEASVLHGGTVKIDGIISLEPLLCLIKGNIQLETRGSLLRLFFKCGPEGAAGRIEIDGKQAGVINTRDTDNGINNYKIWTFDELEDKMHDVRIILEEPIEKNTENALQGCLRFYRMESYSGPCRIINSGIGSCSSGKYLKEYWESYVVCYKPDIVVIEALSINDWLQNIPLEKYITNLEMMLKRVRDNGARPILVTVSPIMGAQENSAGIRYDEYVDASRQTAERMEVKVADANRVMKEAIKKDSKGEGIFSDIWHVNKEGNRLYYECILGELIAII